MFWALGFLLLLIALLIPILAIVLHSPLARNLSRYDPRLLDEVMQRIQGIEDEMARLGKSVEELREETDFVHRLLENPDKPDRPTESPPDGS